MFGFSTWDYIVIGSNGFAQLGDPWYPQKNAVEMEVCLEKVRTSVLIPEEFAHICRYGVKSFSHDFGRYTEIVVRYDWDLVNDWELSDDESLNEKYERFWDFMNEAESVDLETDEINAEISRLFSERHNLSEVLIDVVHRRKPGDDEMKIVL